MSLESELGNKASNELGCLYCQSRVVPQDNLYSQCHIDEGKSCLPCTQIMQLDARIAETQAILKRMILERCQLQTRINESHDQILPRVPREILSLIFENPLPDLWTTDLEHRPSKREIIDPMDLGAVCKAWREVVWGTPRLWTSVYVSVHVRRDSIKLSPTNHFFLGLFREWVSRAGQLPMSVQLNITIQTMDNDYTEYGTILETLENNCGPFFDILNRNSTHLQDLTLVCPGNLLKRFTGSLKGIPLLRRLSLCPTNVRANAFWDNTFRVHGSDPPRVQTLVLNNLRPLSVDVDWSNLTQLSATSFNAAESIQVLHRALRLKHCSLWKLASGIRSGNLPPPISNTSLEFLSVNARSNMDINSLFSGITLPSLNSLTLRPEGDTLPYSCLQPFLERSSCMLQSFRVLDAQFCTKRLVRLLRSLPSIEEVVLIPRESVRNHRELFGHLAYTLHNSNGEYEKLLSNLRSFSYMVSDNRDIPWDLIANVIGPFPLQSRPLKIFRLDSLDEYNGDQKLPNVIKVSEAVIKRLIDIEAAGVTLVIPWKAINKADLIRPLHKHHHWSLDRWGYTEFPSIK